MSQWQDDLERQGYTIARQAFSPDEVATILHAWSELIRQRADDPSLIRNASGTVFAARNLLHIFPPAVMVWRGSTLLEIITATLGAKAGLVRGLWFDKPPEQSWSLAWHKDLTIAVRRNDLPSTQFVNPTTKAGVTHVEAPQWLLEQMLTLRIHLDPITPDNGPLQVVAGSHRHGKSMVDTQDAIDTILGEPGDVLVMRPLISHASGNSTSGTTLHRRILHLEFAGLRELPDGYEWHDFVPVA
jgi:ectoine hydroxylase-related dioxygenase (phytanoyl-CoA dioxygenase family)